MSDGPNRNAPASRSRIAPKTLGESMRGRHSHSTLPLGATSAVVSQSDRKPYSPLGGNGELPNGRVGRSRSGLRGPGPIPFPFVLNSYLPSAGAPVSHGMTPRPSPRSVLPALRYFGGIAPERASRRRFSDSSA